MNDGLWLRLAAHANAMAKRLSEGLAATAGVKIVYPTEANEVFATFPAGIAEKLSAEGAVFYPWVAPGDPADGRLKRFVCSFATQAEEVDRFLERARRLVRAG